MEIENLKRELEIISIEEDQEKELGICGILFNELVRKEFSPDKE